jgi:hypothetical protein
MLQNLIVALIVAVCALYILKKYLPAGLRQKLVYALARRGVDETKAAHWFGTEASCGSGCDSCKACAPTDTVAPNGHKVISLKRER